MHDIQAGISIRRLRALLKSPIVVTQDFRSLLLLLLLLAGTVSGVFVNHLIHADVIGQCDRQV